MLGHVLSLAVLILLPACTLADAQLAITDVSTKIDLRSQLVKTVHTIRVINNGDAEATYFEVHFPEPTKGSYAFHRCVMDKTAMILRDVTEVDASRTPSADTKVVKLKTPISAGQEATITLRTVVTHAYLAFPAEIAQQADQYMKYSFQNYFSTPYEVNSQTVTVSGEKIITVNDSPHKGKKESELTVGPYKSISADAEMSYTTVIVKNNAPFLVAKKFVREISVSHWQRVKIDDILSLHHDGAKLQGHFSRVDFQRARNQAPAAIQGWKTHLPVEARDFDYRDEVGNISTSSVSSSLSGHTLTLIPRFPIFGGWSSGYMLNYTLDNANHLASDGNGNYQFKVPLVPHVYDNMIVDDLELRVALPEGATDITVKNKFGFDEQTFDVKHTYLDVGGRPVVVLTKANVVNDHEADFEIKYSLSSGAIYRQPLVLIAAYFCLFSLLIIYLRSDFTIESKSHAVVPKQEVTQKKKV
ncbi:hypothetical protein SARC_01014 [Sphaeroforma arctica JP610]|uniref:Dolichyl-diphosphooligosaccharide--protein glycosyltransferase subunit 1 n=1 Tax=Sphaeroforma arctica JP610 TaxID=667725 RepID=A0A0L0GEY6_9EUKA|nr:hypothetical protein SARC_01014 [Sphaeroforma arctica JP610]KNC86868.1 hypothetical protein SARC_01014 [Sphaeroforma arctica JP610]|eukprot:XP_014160770.1 hypothetical protein SARC_01014 [Sphaeroforma arctica JP610]